MTDLDHIDPASPDLRDELIARLKDVAPEIFVDGAISFDRLSELTGLPVDNGPERYGLTWPGKRAAIAMLQAPSAATLAPDLAGSVNFDSAQHVFIEGENLEVLKLLYKSYFGRVKLIYIDPPYNTTNDFIYHDNFADPLTAYLIQTGQMTESGDMTTSAPEKAGRFHSNWLSMMYPRLSMARQLLKEDGIILISLNDAEAANLRLLCDDVFGTENFIAQMVWEKGRKNDAKLLSVGHEYVFVYARSMLALKEAKTIWREEKPGAREIWDEYVRLRAAHGDGERADKVIEQELTAWFSELPKAHPAKKWSRYKRVDANGPWRDRDISWPGGDGPRYDVLHPITKQPCKVPEAGWRYADPAEMQRQIDLGLVVFREDHTEPPFRKAHIRPIAAELESEDETEETDDEAENEELATQVRGTYFYKQSQVSVKYLRDLMGAKVFDNPKDHEELAKLFRYMATNDGQPIIMDFFAGSGSSGEAVIRLAANGMPGARYIGVQLPVAVNAKERTGKAALAKGWKTITQVTGERLRRVLALPEIAPSGQGLRTFRLGASNIRRWTGVEDKTPEGYIKQMDAFADTLVPGWEAEDVIWEVALREGYPLTASVSPIGEANPPKFWKVADPDSGRAFTICLAEHIDLEMVKPLGLAGDHLFVCRDTALDDTVAANLALQCRLKVL